jgi:hypothetical protein
VQQQGQQLPPEAMQGQAPAPMAGWSFR